MAKIDTLIEDIKKLTLVEVSELVKALEKEFGVSAAAVAAVAAAPAAGGAAAPAAAEAAAEKANYTIMLKSAGANKIPVIKVVKDITGLGISEAKALVDAAPKAVKENVPSEEAKGLVAKLKEAGADAELA
ncbi:MAG: 50S ribosomal protein L7/L12 [Firmicutes bacterium]|nr:50S ribosomal protein L7/L12 [Bacillota bacterium]